MADLPSFTPTKSSPLSGLPAPFGGITLEDRPFVGKVIVRGNLEDSAFADAVKGVIGCDLPAVPNTTGSSPAHTVFWLGPNEWQIHCAEDTQYGLIDRLREALGDRHAALVDVSDYYALMRLSGEKTLEVLAKGTPLDLHPRAFPAGRCAQTRFGHATVLLHKLEDSIVDLQVRWSFAAYVWSYIVDGTREYRASP
ncbi:MAG: sarcosine oxidase subunit gamma family protein [Arenicellales bacterium]